MGRLPVSKMAIPRTCERMQPGNRSKATNQNPQVPTLTNSRAETKTNPHQIIPFEQGRIEKELKSLGSSPIKLDILEECLHHYPSKDAVLLYEGFKYGFKIPFKGQRGYSYSSNHGSALNNPDIISKKLMNEVELGRVAGPYDYLPLEHLKISPIGLVPKSTPGDFRLIFDLSFPRGSSINAGIDQEDSSVIYTNFDEVIKMVLKEGKGSYLIKTDIKSAFRLLPINPSDFELLGMKFQGKYYIDKCLPFGLSVSCNLFEKFSCFLEWQIKQNSNSDNIIHYLDDFCGCDKDKKGALSLLEKSLETFETLGVPIAPEKIEGPSTKIKFLGLEVDTIAMEIRLPEDKLNALKACVKDTILKKGKKISLRELQSLIGKLNFACRAIAPGRAFLRRLIDATIGIRCPHHRIRVSNAMVADLQVWQLFLENFNGVQMMVDLWTSNPLDLYTDASGEIGYGAYFHGHWAFGKWPLWLKRMRSGLHITFKELFPIVLSLVLWGHEWANQKVTFHCDNQAIVFCINKQSTREKSSMHLLRMLVALCLKHNIVFKAVHIAGKSNAIADALSRLQILRFKELAPQADPLTTPVPNYLWQELKKKLKG